jgi:predicted HD phosphohydrolase
MEFTQSPREKAEALISTLVKYGQGDYIGESISQLEHSLQAANQARNDRKSFTYQINLVLCDVVAITFIMQMKKLLSDHLISNCCRG